MSIDRLKKSKYAIALKRDRLVIVANRQNGKWIKMTKECFEIVEKLSEARLTLDEMIQCFQTDEDKKYIQRLLNKLIEIEVLINEEQSELSKLCTVSIILTKQCNLSCLHCCEDANLHTYENELTTEEVLRLVDKIIGMDVSRIMLTGGEPLLRDDLEYICKYISDNFKGKLVLLTNGLLIDEKNVSWLVNVMDGISISIDGADAELTEIVRGENVHDKVIKKVKLLQANGFDKISLSAILPNSRIVEDNFEKLCESLKVKSEIRHLSLSGRGEKNRIYLDNEYKKYLEKNKFPFSGCLYEREDIAAINSCGACETMLTIDYNGNVYPCNLLHDNKFKIGNIRENVDFLDDYFNKKEYIDFINYKRYIGTKCETCDVNIFCWTCISEMNDFLIETDAFNERCKVRKKIIGKRIWGDEV